MIQTNRMAGYHTYSSLGVALAFAACLALIGLMRMSEHTNPIPLPEATLVQVVS